MKDQVFKEKMDQIHSFAFNEDVASVFDDMISRSIPYYHEIHKVILDIISKIHSDEITIYDLGCSTGTSLELISKHFSYKKLNLIGIDSSPAMVAQARKKLAKQNIQILEADLLDYKFQEKADLIIMNYTLQFIDQNERDRLLSTVYKAMNAGSYFLLSEKIVSKSKIIESLQTELYYDFKRRNGYSELEISQKREALENVMTPICPDEQIEALKRAGLQNCDNIFRYYNFASYLSYKC